MQVLLVDDLRGPDHILKNYGLKVSHIVTTYSAAVKALQDERWDVLLLDHDLADFDTNGREFTGYDVALFLEQNPELVPKKIVIVSSNPVGRDKIKNALLGHNVV